MATEILIVMGLLMLAVALGHYLKKSKHKYLQESGLTVILGVVAGGLFKLFKMES